ncbi:M48 family metallopeptidase [Sneathiella marina]|uniref:M48 family metallopeptidase n=1 Tax=Sneathiella marina TaxID=2950108 RepID=A0ABY4VZ91_9PROT|nr:M48 family metallopeptidase [Sneathiella marina]USG60153.1 M48 family metallopeptidase [Sneathiella marina]
MATFLARLFDGKTAKAQSVSVEIEDGSLKIISDTGSLMDKWPLASLRDENAGPAVGELRLSVAADNAARLIVEDPDFIRDVNAKCPRLYKSRPLVPGWWKPYVFWGGGAIASVIFIFAVVLPVLTTQIAWILPDKLREDIGEQTKSFLIESIARKQNSTADAIICRDPEGEREISRVLQQLNVSAGDEVQDLQVTVIKSPIANAFALPGGKILIFSGLLDLADEANGFTGVLAHELGHAKFRHPMKSFILGTGVATIFSLLVGDASGGVALAAIGQMAVSSTYSRELETEADEMAILLMQSAGFDVSPMNELLQKIHANNKTETFDFALFDTHPGIEDRLALITSAGKTGGGAMSSEAWEHVKKMCR